MNTHTHTDTISHQPVKCGLMRHNPGGTVSYTYNTSLIRGRGGTGVGVGLRDTEHVNIKGGGVEECS